MRRSLDPGQFKHFITVEKATETKAASGAATKDWDSIEETYERWAAIDDPRSVRFERLQVIHTHMTAAFTMPGWFAAEVGMRVTHDERTFDVIGVETEGNVRPINAPYVTLICEGRQ